MAPDPGQALFDEEENSGRFGPGPAQFGPPASRGSLTHDLCAGAPTVPVNNTRCQGQCVVERRGVENPGEDASTVSSGTIIESSADGADRVA
ncbi:hypothetical protein N7539_000641 [Penicillium diatomitis]|uniref:Uncharacterized protein n=1 Tax=Penicillium diatomitis TaxID=2819901 RepID=A0A9W9XMX0_9EURO|nr:uncharacterized protein N7539_000641 [Penicillium diatomitis]KAJ5495525.1 hypothetical protein N7539_000641 [Penicillium diatomitis]